LYVLLNEPTRLTAGFWVKKQQRSIKMIIEKTAENYDILKTYHGLVRGFYKELLI
jgi:hypothetical protein